MADRDEQQLGNYRLVRMLGEGGFAKVYLGEHVHLYTKAAIKVLHNQLTSDDVEKFITEARNLARLIHPHIIRVLDFGVEGKTPYLVMDYASNGTLRQRHHRGTPLALSVVIDYVKQVADALQFAHNQKLIHRDIKPENMLLGQNNEILLSDFGIAIVAQSSRYQHTQDMAGTIAYMAPEQIQAHPRPASDQYSLGVVVYEWLTGNRPFNGSFTEIAIKHSVVPPPSLREKVPTIPTEVEQIVLTALAKDPKDRFLTIQAFATALEQASTSTFTSSYTPYIPPSPEKTLLAGNVSTPEFPDISRPAPPSRIEPTMPVSSPSSPILTPQTIWPDGGNRGMDVQRPTNLVGQTNEFTQAKRNQQNPKFGLSIGISFLLVVLVGSSILYTKGFFPFTKNSNSSGGGPSSATSAAKAPAAQQVLNMPFENQISDLKTMDPALSTDAASIAGIDLVFTGLVQFDNNLKVQPQLASSYSVSSDGLTWTFHLRPNLKFSDGTPLTSADVVYSINRALLPATKSVVGPVYLGLIKDSDKLNAGKIPTIIDDSLLTPDPNTVVIIANKQAAYFLDALAYSTSYVVEKSVVDKYGANWTDHLADNGGQGGDGPFKVQSWTHGTNITFVPNPNYYGPQPQLTKLIYPFYKDTATNFSAYQAGQTDYSQGVPTADLSIAKALPNNQYQSVPQLWINYYTMNYLVKPFDNIHIRQAFDLAINKDLIVHSVYKDTYIATNHIVPKGMPGYNPNLTAPDGVTGTSGDTTKAKALLQQGLQEEGWTSVSQMPAIKLTYNSGDPNLNNEISALQQMWQTTLGINVKANPEEFNKLLTDSEAALNNPNGLQFWGIGWIADYPDPQDWTTLQFGQGSQYNQINYGQNNTSNAVIQQQVQLTLEAADANPDQNARLQAYNQAEQQLVNDVAWLPMEQVAYSQVLKPYVMGMVFNSQLLIPPNDWGKVFIATH